MNLNYSSRFASKHALDIFVAQRVAAFPQLIPSHGYANSIDTRKREQSPLKTPFSSFALALKICR
jgi:hypothetical protein